MTNIKLTIEYDGTDFRGWQIQARGERTVQAVIKDTFLNIFREDINVIGSGRTDSGVHAAGQVANFRTSIRKSPGEIQSALNARLPADVSIRTASAVRDGFHAQYDARRKTYRYQILNRKVRSPLWSRTALLYPHNLDLDRMRRGASILLGQKDFGAFKGANRDNRTGSDIRTITDLSIVRRGDLIRIDVTANGFLYKMVRNITGALIACGNGRLSARELGKILRSRDRRLAPAAAAAHGLCLLRVAYGGPKIG